MLLYPSSRVLERSPVDRFLTLNSTAEMKSAMAAFKIIQSTKFTVAYRTCCRRYCTTEEVYTLSKKKIPHPYLKIHPWKSEHEFTKHLLNNIIYNSDGIVAINKPYGISTCKYENFSTKPSSIVGEVNYSISEVLSYIARELGTPTLIPCTGLEKYVSGVYVLATNNNIQQQVQKAIRRAAAFGKFKKYWAITIKHPNEIKGSYHLAIKSQQSKSGLRKVIFVNKWSKNEEKRQDVKIMNVKYKLLSNSTHNLSSLIEIESSARKWQCVRLFASVMLYSPILGDNFHGSRVQNIMGTWMKVDPFADSCLEMPKVDRQLLELLQLTPRQQEIIPTHLHVKSICLDAFGKEKKNLVLEAPLIHPFDWTCKQLMFKNIPSEVNYTNVENKVETNST